MHKYSLHDRLREKKILYPRRRTFPVSVGLSHTQRPDHTAQLRHACRIAEGQVQLLIRPENVPL